MRLLLLVICGYPFLSGTESHLTQVQRECSRQGSTLHNLFTEQRVRQVLTQHISSRIQPLDAHRTKRFINDVPSYAFDSTHTTHSPTTTARWNEAPGNIFTNPEAESEQRRSLCPWDYVEDRNDTRIPQRIYRARCHSQDCDYSFMNFGQSCAARLGVETECAVVITNIEVGCEYCVNGTYFIRTEWIDWPVACTCSRKKIRTVSNNP